MNLPGLPFLLRFIHFIVLVFTFSTFLLLPFRNIHGRMFTSINSPFVQLFISSRLFLLLQFHFRHHFRLTLGSHSISFFLSPSFFPFLPLFLPTFTPALPISSLPASSVSSFSSLSPSNQPSHLPSFLPFPPPFLHSSLSQPPSFLPSSLLFLLSFHSLPPSDFTLTHCLSLPLTLPASHFRIMSHARTLPSPLSLPPPSSLQIFRISFPPPPQPFLTHSAVHN